MAPPKVKLHSKPGAGKLKTISKSKPIVAQPSTSTSNGNDENSSTNLESDEVQQRFQLELAWCIQKLEESLNSKKLNQKQTDDTLKTLKVLCSKTQTLIKKRQLMRQTFGDYRAKMAEDERKFALDPNSFQFKGPPSGKESYFVKKAAILESGKEFKFNFTVDKLEDLSLENVVTSVPDNEDKINLNLNPKKVDMNLGAGGSFVFNFNINQDETESESKTSEIKET